MSVADAFESRGFQVEKCVCRDFEQSSRLEWLETNHTGAFGMGTVAGVNTRRYHSLLTATLHPPTDRVVVLSRVEEQATIEGRSFELATVQYSGAVSPAGYLLLEEFTIDPFPKWRYRVGETFVEKTICLLDREQTVLVRYRANAECRLNVRLLLAFRDYHSLTRENPVASRTVGNSGQRLSIRLYPDLPELVIFHSGDSFQEDGIWYKNHEYLRELERGLDFREDLYSPGSLIFDLNGEQGAWLLASVETSRSNSLPGTAEIEQILSYEDHRRRFRGETELQATLRRALDQFRVVRSDDRPTLIAGYPWFTDWSRDTLISLPALRRAGFPSSEVRAILELLIKERVRGLVPNRFLDLHSNPEYNTADATLWLFIAGHDFIEATGDATFLREILFPAAQDILEWHHRGTDFDIRVDPADHLLTAGSESTQLTWMDARVDGTAVTPRNGKPVEINALWYNALRIASHWAARLGDTRSHLHYAEDADRTLSSFRAKFWNPERGCLYDVLGPDSVDARMRPNQLFTLSLPFALLDRSEARSIVQSVKSVLLTPVGLRTLEPGDPAYQARFEGDMAARDHAYHQGTIWPWLLGPFVQAYLYAYESSPEALGFCKALVSNMAPQLTACCLGSLSEVYDAEPPRRPSGCPAQLWSVAQFFILCQRLGL